MLGEREIACSKSKGCLHERHASWRLTAAIDPTGALVLDAWAESAAPAMDRPNPLDRLLAK